MVKAVSIASMSMDVDTKNIDAVCAECVRLYHSMYDDAKPDFLPWACDWFRRIFDGNYKDYLPIDIPYHDREHTMQGLLCFVRLLHGRHKAAISPLIPRKDFELGVLGILFHDTGYLKRTQDTDGTGAKYTLIHVDRSKEFAAEFMTEHGYSADSIKSVINMIQCTAMSDSLKDISFSSPVERVVGCALATADLLGQMSAPDYIDRLPQLYDEFKESCVYFGNNAGRLQYDSPESLVANTPAFWESYVKPKLDGACDGVYRYLSDPYPDGPNPYLERIEANLRRAAARDT